MSSLVCEHEAPFPDPPWVWDPEQDHQISMDNRYDIWIKFHVYHTYHNLLP